MKFFSRFRIIMLVPLLSLAAVPAAEAVIAAPGVREHTQSDGTVIRYRLNGDEFLSFVTDYEGNLVEFGPDGDLYIAEWVSDDDFDSTKRSDVVTPTQRKPHGFAGPQFAPPLEQTQMRPLKNEVPKYLLEKANKAREERDKAWRKQFENSPQASARRTDFAPGDEPISRKVLMIYVSFIDKTGIEELEADRPQPSVLHTMVFDENTFGTVAHFYKTTTGGKALIKPAEESQGTANDGIIFVELDGPHQDWGRNGDPRKDVVKPALIAANRYINYASFDTNKDRQISSEELSIGFIVEGYESSSGGTPGIWGYASGLYDPKFELDGVILNLYFMVGAFQTQNPPQLLTIGIIVHELGHSCFGFMDLYDVGNIVRGIGYWSVMANGCWGAKGDEERMGATPTALDAFHLQRLQISPVAGDAGSVSLDKVYNYAKITNAIRPNQYFLVQPRGYTGYDMGISDLYSDRHGLLIYHVDDDFDWSNDMRNNAHPHVSIKEAHGGIQDLSTIGYWGDAEYTDLFSLDTKIDFNSSTDPASWLFHDIYSTSADVDSGVDISDITSSITGQNTKDGTVSGSFSLFVPVSEITGVPTDAVIGTPLTLTGTVDPSSATNKTIVWSVSNAGTTNASIDDDNIFTATSAGTATVTAAIANGLTDSDYTWDFNITVRPFVPVGGIKDVPTDAVVRIPLQLTGTVDPSGATNKTIVWSVSNAGTTNASIDNNNKFLAAAAGGATITATIINGAAISSNYTRSFYIDVKPNPGDSTSINLDSLNGSESFSGNKWSYDQSTGTITITSASTLTVTGTLPSSSLTIDTTATAANVIFRGNASAVVVNGNGKLTVDTGASINNITSEGDVEINGGTVSSASGQAIKANRNVTVSGGTVSSPGFPDPTINAGGDVTVSDRGVVKSTGTGGTAIKSTQHVQIDGGGVFADIDSGTAIDADTSSITNGVVSAGTTGVDAGNRMGGLVIYGDSKTATIYGNKTSVTVEAEIEIPSEITLKFNQPDAFLDVASGATIRVNGTLDTTNGTVNVNGNLTGSGKVTGDGSLVIGDGKIDVTVDESVKRIDKSSTGSGPGSPSGTGTGSPAGPGTDSPAESGTGSPADSGTGSPAGPGTGSPTGPLPPEGDGSGGGGCDAGTGASPLFAATLAFLIWRRREKA